jgi:lambda family phage tail tape measure protein
MATIDQYKLVLDVQGQQAVDRLSKSLGGLKTEIAGIGFAAFTNSVLQMADAVSDLASATGLAIGDIAAFSGALQQAGGKSADASKMIGAFFQQIDKAASGNEAAQKALDRVGISFKDLGNLSEKDLLKTALASLKEMGPGAERTAAGIEILGKSFRNIDAKVLEEAFRTGDFSKAEEALKKMGNLADSLAANFYTLQIAGAQVFSQMATAIEPFIGKVEDGRLSLDQAEKIIKAVGIGLAIAFGAKTVATIIDIVTVVKSLTTALKGTVIVQTALTALSGPRGWAIIAAGAVAATAAVVGLNKALGDTNSEMGTATGGTDAGGQPAGPKRKTQFYSDEEQKARQQALVTAQQATMQMKLQNDEANKLRQITIDTIGMESSLGGVIKSNADIRAKTANEIKDLEGKIQVEQSKGRGTNQGVITELEKQIGLKKDQLTATLALNRAEYERNIRLQEVTTAIQTDAMLASRQKDLDLMRQQIEFGTAITLEDQTQLKLMALQNEETKKRIDLTKELKLAEQAGNQVAIDDIQLRMAEDTKYYEQRRQLEQTAYDVQIARRNDSVAGAKTAMESIARSMDPFMLAQNATTSMFNNMNSAIDNFVTTGKFKFGDFARSVIQDLAKMALKAQATKLFGSMFGGAGGIFGSLFMAEGGPVKGNQPYIVGEKGPELFVPPSAGKIIPNNQMGAKASTPSMGNAPITNTYITNNVSAIDSKSVAEFFATNRRTMLGTMQLAQKELPYGNR